MLDTANPQLFGWGLEMELGYATETNYPSYLDGDKLKRLLVIR